MSGSEELIQRLRSLLQHPPAPSGWREVDQATIDRFGEVSGDRQWIHLDPRRAERDSPFGTTVAHGMLTLSLAPALAIELLGLGGARLVINYGLERVRFPAPLPAGSRVRMHLELIELIPFDEGARLELRVRFEAEGRVKPVCAAQLILLVHP